MLLTYEVLLSSILQQSQGFDHGGFIYRLFKVDLAQDFGHDIFIYQGSRLIQLIGFGYGRSYDLAGYSGYVGRKLPEREDTRSKWFDQTSG